MNPFERPSTEIRSRSHLKGGEKKKKTEQDQRSEQLELVRRWRKLQVKWDPNENGGRLLPNQEDIEAYVQQRRRHGGMGMYGSEAAAFAEYMVLETLDADGVISGTRSVMRGHAYAYEPSDIDDVLCGTDALVLYTGLDEAEERFAYPVSIDVTLDPEESKIKQMRDLRHVSGEESRLSRVYWYDTRSDEAGLAFDQPSEGRVRALNTTVYVPGELAELYVSSSTDSAVASAALKRVGLLALEQQRWQLELTALLLIGGVRPARGSFSVVIDQPSRGQVLAELGQTCLRQEDPSTDRAYAAKVLTEILPSIWQARGALTIPPGDLRLIRSARIMKEFEGLLDDVADVASAE